MKRQALLLAALVILLRLPFLNEAVQGDDVYYLYGAQHAQIDPLHPLHTHYAFLGDMVDMRGHPHGPLNAWVLGGLIAIFGGVREVPFHLAYLAFSLAAAFAMLSLARRFCPERALLASILFTAVPAFVVNGNSFETDLVFLAFWVISIAYYTQAIHTRSAWLLTASAVAGGLAALDAFQAGMLMPILGLYLWMHDRKWTAGWIATLAAPFTIVAWQAWEWASSGTLPIAVLLGYMQSHAFQAPSRKIESATALIGHAGWIVFPALVAAAFWRSAGWWRWALVGVAGVAAFSHDANPLFWGSVAMGTLLILSCIRRDFLSAWVLLFFAASLLIFFAGSARYLLPIAAPVAILIARQVPTRALIAGIGVQFVIALGLATANHVQWAEVRDFSNAVMDQANGRRVWVDAEWGLRHYLEERGARPLLKDTVLRGDDILVSSELGTPVPITVRAAKWLEKTISPTAPFRIISIEGGSGYSASAKGLLPFEVSTEMVDRLHADIVLERKPELSFLDPKDPRTAAHVIGGLFPDGWMVSEATVLLEVPEKFAALKASVYIPADAPARTVTLIADGKVVATQTVPAPGAYTITAPFHTHATQVTVTLRVDKTHRVPPDSRDLGAVVTGIGFE